jgi:rhamnogalacturonan endolyase
MAPCCVMQKAIPRANQAARSDLLGILAGTAGLSGTLEILRRSAARASLTRTGDARAHPKLLRLALTPEQNIAGPSLDGRAVCISPMQQHPNVSAAPVTFWRRQFSAARLVGLAAFLVAPVSAFAAFGLSSTTDFYTVDTGAGLVFKVRRTDNGSSTQSAGDIASLVYNGVEYQNQSRGSQVNSGFDYLYNGVSAVSVSGGVVNTSYIKITVQAGNLTHYYMARSGYPHIYMATYFTTEPDTLGLCRYIVRIPSSKLPNGPVPSDIRNNTGAIESGDIFGMSDGTTRSKHYSNMRLKDWSYIGATGSGVGVWIVRDNQEGASGGPFYRSLLNQCGSDQEITYIVNYGEAQTEAMRTGILNSYTMVFTGGGTPGGVDTSWFSSMGLTGYIGSSGRGRVTGVGITGRDTNYAYTVGFANSKAQYWADARSTDGYFNCTGMIPGTYTMTIYKGELAVNTRSVTVTAGGTVALNTIGITGDPSSQAAIFRIGNWDGTPKEFRNGDKITTMHPSDVRMSSWNPGTFTVGSSSTSSFPAYQWKDINGTQTVKFNLTSSQIADHTVRVGITVAYSGARPKITVNSWTSANPSASTQPSTRTLTVGTYRGNNTTYSFTVPASAFVAGTNTMTIVPISGSGLTGYLSAGYSVDCVDMY